MRIQVTHVVSDEVITDAIATLYALGKRPTESSVRALVREWYERGGSSIEIESVDERNFVDDIEIDDDAWTLAILSPLRARLSERGWAS